jgi:tetratricopeptide (TPR) repeat protein
VSLDWTADLFRPPPPRRRRWPYVLGGVATLGLLYVSVAGGAAKATGDLAAQAAQQRDRGNYGEAAALYLEMARRTSPLFVFAHGAVNAAALDEQRTVLAWARSLAAHGQVDQALGLAASVTDPSVLTEAQATRGSLLLDAAKASASAGDYGTALLRLRQLQHLVPVTPVAAQGAALIAEYEVGAARSVAAAGRGTDAVALLDDALNRGPSGRAAAEAALPSALLAAGQEQIAATSYKEAAASLQRLVHDYPNSAPARTARSLLSQRQSVSGTLTDKRGQAISGQVRLSSNFQNLGGSYLTSGPFFYATASATGDFRFDAVPVGGPYVLEVFRGGDWTTLIDPSTGRPAQPVNVAPLEPVDLTFVVFPS